MKKHRVCEFLFAIVLTCLIGCATPTTKFLPPSAKIVLMGAGHDPLANPQMCVDFSLTENQVRQMFATYRVLTPEQLHHKYLWSECYIEGQIMANGKSYQWRARAGNTLETDYPDAKPVILGGIPTDGP